MRRSTVLGSGVAIIVTVAAVAWVVGSQIRSPAEIAAQTAAPDPSLISVPVEQHPLSSEVVARGTVRFGSPQAVSLPTSALKAGNGVVTTAPIPGATLNEGDTALTISGRPVLILQGGQPAYRDLGIGAQGTDVQQLEEGLARLGFSPGAVDGVYDRATGNGVAAFYRSAGWTPFGPTDEQVASLHSVQADRFGAQSEVIAAEDSLGSARTSLAAATADVINKSAAVDNAFAARHVAQVQLDEARASTPPPSASELASLDAAVLEAGRAIGTAQADLAAAHTAAAAAADAVRLAERQLSLAGSQVANAGAVSTTLGVQVPANEILFFPTLPLRIGEVTVAQGEEPTGPLMTISGSQLAVEGALAISDAKIVRQGAPVSIEAADLGIRASGTVSTVADAPGTLGVDPQRFYFQVTPKDAPASLVGASVVLKITVGSTKGDVLAVPVAGISVAGDGSSRVEVQRPDGSTRTVTVNPGLAAKGLVAVTPVRGRLARGDRVIVGRGATPRGSGTSAGTATGTGRDTRAL